MARLTPSPAVRERAGVRVVALLSMGGTQTLTLALSLGERELESASINSLSRSRERAGVRVALSQEISSFFADPPDFFGSVSCSSPFSYLASARPSSMGESSKKLRVHCPK
jgi:hypothetical protein